MSSAPDSVNPFDAFNTGSFIDPEPVIRNARISADPLQPIPDKLSMTDDVALALEPAFRGASVSTESDASDCNKRFALRLIALCDFPVWESQHAELIWAPYRCLFAGFGWAMHSFITRTILSQFPTCPWDPADDQTTWYDEAVKARQTCGVPLGMIRVAWRVVAAAYPLTAGHPPTFDVFLDLAARVEIARYARRRRSIDGRTHFVWLGGHDTFSFPFNYPKLPMIQSMRVMQSSVDRMLKHVPGSDSKRNPEYHAPSVSMRRLLAARTSESLEYLRPVSSLGAMVLCAPWPVVQPVAETAGLIPVQRGVLGTWNCSAKNGTTRLTPTDPHISLLEVDWSDQPADASANTQYARIVDSMPATPAPVRYPHEHMIDAFPHMEFPVSDHDAYLAMLDSIMIVPFLGFPDTKREFPLVFSCPHDPTIEGSTNTGKTTLAEALARVFAPGVKAARVVGGGSPDVRSFAANLKTHGTAAVDEFVSTRLSDNHPLREENLMAVATGGLIDVGMVMSNDAHGVGLRYPIFISSKVVYGRSDTFNRAFRLEVSRLEKSDPGVYQAIVDGYWSFAVSLDCRLIATQLEPAVKAVYNSLATSGASWRYLVHRATAAHILAVREQIPADLAANRIDRLWSSMTDRFTEQVSLAASNGLTATAADSSGITALTVDSLFSGDILEDDSFSVISALGAVAVRQVLQEILRQRGLDSVADLFGHTFGEQFRCSEQQACRVFVASVRKLMPNPGDVLVLSGHRGASGWTLVRDTDRNGTVRVHLSHAGVDSVIDTFNTSVDSGVLPDIPVPEEKPQ